MILRTTLFTILMLTVFSCTVKEKPVFVKLENMEVVESTSKFITLKADAVFLNPNDVGGELKTDGLKVFVNDNEITTVSSESFKVPAKDEFSIPLQAKVAVDSIIGNKNIGGLLGSLITKTIKVQYKGPITYKVFGFSYSYDIDETETIKL